MPDLQIHPLSEKPEYANDCAVWCYGEWGVHKDSFSIEKSIEAYSNSTDNKDKMPLTWLGFEGSFLAGMISLVEDDHEDHKDLSPWLASMYVHPSFRRKGYAAALIQHLHKEAKNLGHDHLYLFTPDMMPLYEKNGWKVTQNVRDPRGIHDHEKLMEITL